MSDPKPIAEVFAAIYIDALREISPDCPNWSETAPRQRALVLHGMHQVIGALELFGIGVQWEGSVARLVQLERKNPERMLPPSLSSTALSPTDLAREQARLGGYEGDACQQCGVLMMIRNGSCLKCMSCGETTGCS